MKKTLFIFIVLFISLSVCFAGGSKGSSSAAVDPVLDAIQKAEKMSLSELEAAAKAEFEAAGTKYVARSITSGMKNVLSGFKEKYPWFDYEEFSSSKDQALYTELTTGLGQNQFVSDIAIVQDGSSLQSLLINTGYVYNYKPKSTRISDADKDPLVALYTQKVILWNRTNPEYGMDYVQNVWQLTGADGLNLKGVHQLSFQNPANEGINMNFLIMLTSPDACEKLAKAYKSYFGNDYAGGDGYKNIGYKFVTELLRNVTTWHSSDTTAVKNVATLTDGQVIYAPFNKVKDYPSTNDYHTDLAMSGWNLNLEGFDSFFYKMWIVIPKTARLPYTTCLLIEYFCTEEGFTNGWSSEGYYSVNPDVPVVAGDKTLSEWLKTAIVEDSAYIDSVYKDVSTYIRSIVNN